MQPLIKLDRPLQAKEMDLIKWAWQYVGTDTYMKATMPSDGNLRELTKEYFIFMYPRKGGKEYQLLFNNPYDGRYQFEVRFEVGKTPLQGGYSKRMISLAEDIITNYIKQAETNIKDAERRGDLPWMTDPDNFDY